MKEEWRYIEGYNEYMVSNFGKVKSLSYNKTGKEKVLTPCIDRKGYLFVTLHGKQIRVHRLVNGNRKRIAEKHKKKVYCYKNGVLQQSFNSISEAAKHFGVSINNISSCLNGRKKRACNLEWSFELNKEYYDKACKRIRDEQAQLQLFP